MPLELLSAISKWAVICHLLKSGFHLAKPPCRSDGVVLWLFLHLFKVCAEQDWSTALVLVYKFFTKRRFYEERWWSSVYFTLQSQKLLFVCVCGGRKFFTAGCVILCNNRTVLWTWRSLITGTFVSLLQSGDGGRWCCFCGKSQTDVCALLRGLPCILCLMINMCESCGRMSLCTLTPSAVPVKCLSSVSTSNLLFGWNTTNTVEDILVILTL